MFIPLNDTLYMPYPRYPSTSNMSINMDAATEKVAYVFRAPKSGIISGFKFYAGIVTTGGKVMKGSLQGVDANGDPDGTILASGNAYGTVTISAIGTKTIAFTGNATVAVNDKLVVVLEWNDTGDAGNCQISATANRIADNFYIVNYVAAWVKSSGALALSLTYTDGMVVSNNIISPFLGTNATQTINSSSGVDEVGNLFYPPFDVTISGLWAFVDADNPFSLCLYDGSSNLIVSRDFVTAEKTVTSTSSYVAPVDPIILRAGNPYRVTILPTSTSNIGYMVAVGIDSAWAPMGAAAAKTARTNGGAWTNTQTDRISVCVLVSHIDVNPYTRRYRGRGGAF